MKSECQRLFAILTVALLSIAASAFSGVPGTMSYQGRLTDGGGTPVADGSYTVTFTIYADSTGGASLWTETQSVTTSSGLFSVLLGKTTSVVDTVFKQAGRFLGIKVGADPELTPRTRLVTTPFAYRVSTVDGANGGTINSAVWIAPSTSTPNYSPNLYVRSTDGELVNHSALEAAADSGSLAVAIEAYAGSFDSDDGDRIALRAEALATGASSDAYGVSAYASSTADGAAIALLAQTDSDSTSAAAVFLGNRVIIAANSSDLGYSNAIGSYYRDNSIVAWGNVNDDGSIGSEFGVIGVSHTPGSGTYEITLDVTTSGNDPNLLVMNATPEIDAIPTSAATARFISVDQITGSGNSFRVYITDGTFTAVDNEFTFIVTGR